MKNILCKLGFHSPDKYEYIVVTRRHKNGKKYHKNFIICKKCGKRLRSFAKRKGGTTDHAIHTENSHR